VRQRLSPISSYLQKHKAILCSVDRDAAHAASRRSEQAGNDERAGTQKVVATRTFRTPIRRLSGIGDVRSHGQVLGESSATLGVPCVSDGTTQKKQMVFLKSCCNGHSLVDLRQHEFLKEELLDFMEMVD
jgi:hypothetical protein